jgi:hypothetical protein
MSDEEFSSLVDGALAERPPLGLSPRNIHDAIRMTDILFAMRRYVDAGKQIPGEWLDELEDRNRSLKP